MKEFFLDTHSSICENHKNSKYDDIALYHAACELQKKRFLFFLGNKFFIVTYHKCMEYGDSIQFKEDLVKTACENFKIFNRYEVNRGVNTSTDLRELRLRGKPLRKYIRQVNYLYKNDYYAITTTANYIDAICNQDLIQESYLEAKNYILEREYNYLIPELNNLFNANRLIIDEVDYAKTIDHLLEQIKQSIK